MTFAFLGKKFKVGKNSRCYLLVLIYHRERAKLEPEFRSPRERQDAAVVRGKAGSSPTVVQGSSPSPVHTAGVFRAPAVNMNFHTIWDGKTA